MTLFECRGLTRRPWIERFELRLEAGEIAVLTGPTGSGKTQLLRTIADLDPADAGEVRLDGVERGGMRPDEWRSRVLYLHQTPVRLPGSVRDNLERITSLAVHAGRHATLAAPSGLAAERPVELLSGGEAQYLALDRALALDPRVLLLDEATSALDEERARAAEAAVTTWTRASRGAVLWVSHDPGLADRLQATSVVLP